MYLKIRTSLLQDIRAQRKRCYTLHLYISTKPLFFKRINSFTVASLRRQRVSAAEWLLGAVSNEKPVQNMYLY